MAEESAKTAVKDGKGFGDVLADLARILNIPGGFPPSNPSVPARLIFLLTFVLQDKIIEIPVHSRIRLFVKSSLLGRPLRHVQPIKRSNWSIFMGSE